MTVERLAEVLVRPLWIASASGWAAWTAVLFLTHPWEFLQ